MSGDEIRADERERVAHWRNGLQHAARLAREPYDTPAGMFVRQTRPGDPCGYCRTTMGESLVCPGCRWVDPPRGRELRESSSSPASGPSSWTGGGRDATADQERVAQIRARAEAATSGPWEFAGTVVVGGRRYVATNVTHQPDVAFIAAAREDVPWLLAALDVCRGERDTALSRIAAVAELAEKWAKYEAGYGGYPEASAHEDGKRIAYEIASDALCEALGVDSYAVYRDGGLRAALRDPVPAPDLEEGS